MELIPYEKRFLEQIRAIDASAAQQLEFNGDVYLETAQLAVSDDRQTLLGFSYLSGGTLNYGIFNINAEAGADPSSDDGAEALLALFESLKSGFLKLRPEIPHENVYLTAWASDERDLYTEFLEAEDFRKNRAMFSLEKELKQVEYADSETGSLMVTTPEGLLKEALIQEINIKDLEVRKAYLSANGLSFGFPESEKGLDFRVNHWKARVFAAVLKEDPDEILAAVTVWPRRNGRCATEDIFCIPSYRRQHLTQKLIETIHQKLRKEGFLYAGMNAFARNEEALALYKKLGYQVKGTVFEYIWP